MSVNSRHVHAPASAVWDVLADGWLYPLWVVGASRMRDVEKTWPAAGSRIHHSIGIWPTLIDDHTRVLKVDPQHSIRLLARAWPMGAAEVEISLEPLGTETTVTIKEDAVAGPGVFVPKPMRDLPLKWRNTETLRRLALIAENRP